MSVERKAAKRPAAHKAQAKAPKAAVKSVEEQVNEHVAAISGSYVHLFNFVKLLAADRFSGFAETLDMDPYQHVIATAKETLVRVVHPTQKATLSRELKRKAATRPVKPVIAKKNGKK